MDFWQALEAGDYARAWAKTAPYFQRDLSQAQWVRRMEELRRPLGKAVSRQILSTVFTNPGRRFEQTILTTFDTQQSATETVFCALQPDGEWRVEKYDLGAPKPCEPQASQAPTAGTSLDWRQALGAVAWHAGLILLLLALIGLVIPRFTAIFSEMLDGQALPATTRVILGLGHAVRSSSLLLVVFIPWGLALDFGLCLLAQHLGGRRGQRLWTLAWGMGWLLALAVVALALFVPLRRLAAELASPSPVVTNQALTFGPTLESTLPLSDLGYSYSLNLDSGELQQMPVGMTMADWSTGIQVPDGIIVIAPSTNRALTIAGTGTRVIPLLNGTAAWDNPQPEQLDSLDSLASGKTESVTGESSSPPVTFAFRTAKGEHGLLQIIGYVERPSGVTLRYKRVAGPSFQRSEPSYQGKTLREWLAEVDYGRPQEERTRAGEAIRQMGTNVIPWLLSDLGGGNPLSVEYNRQDTRSADERMRQATWAFDALGPAGRTAIPRLEGLLETSPGYVPAALAGVGRDALPALLKALTNDVFWVRDNAAAAMANAIHREKFSGHEAIAALPIALSNFNYANATNSLYEANTRARAAALLEAIRSDPALKELPSIPK
jgi:hypothetical protein